jgi:hypothetical protein
MAWVFFVVGIVVVVAIALYAVGRAVAQLESERRPAVYELAAASAWIAARLPDEVTARLSFDELGQILGWHLDWFASVGAASEHGETIAGGDVVREGSVAMEDAAVDAVVAKALSAGEAIDALDVVCVLDLQMRYLSEIGAVGETVELGEAPKSER